MTDKEWMEEKLGRPVTEGEVEDFSERVGMFIFGTTMDEIDAMEFALEKFIK